MRPFPNEFGINFSLDQANNRPGTFYFDPVTLAAYIEAKKFDSGSVRVDPTYGVSISLGHRPKKKKNQGADES